MKEKIEAYEALKVEMKILESKADALKEEITAYMVEQGATETPELPMGGKIKIGYTSKWLYPTEILQLQDKLKEEQNRTQIDGSAKETKTPYIKYYSGK